MPSIDTNKALRLYFELRRRRDHHDRAPAQFSWTPADEAQLQRAYAGLTDPTNEGARIASLIADSPAEFAALLQPLSP